VRFISAPYRSRRRLAADNGGALSVLAASIGAKLVKLQVVALSELRFAAFSHLRAD
jgi:hypothetical protein